MIVGSALADILGLREPSVPRKETDGLVVGLAFTGEAVVGSEEGLLEGEIVVGSSLSGNVGKFVGTEVGKADVGVEDGAPVGRTNSVGTAVGKVVGKTVKVGLRVGASVGETVRSGIIQEAPSLALVAKEIQRGEAESKFFIESKLLANSQTGPADSLS